jgi:hypothetical protein
MQWQSELLEYSWKRVEQEGVLVRLVATHDPANMPVHTHAHCFATQSWDHDPDTGDFYPILNKPASLLEWVFREQPEGTVLLLDPDCVFREPVRRRVAPKSPAAQAWIKSPNRRPSAKNPFGLGKGFAFLNDHCARTDLGTEPVMIPMLIHTSDLRMICARWLELCRLIRREYRDPDGNPKWESDMLAYTAACAEYDLDHEPISLGICTNWEPKDAPAAPIIHYCAPVQDKNGEQIFFKQTYSPWASVESDVEPEHDHGRDLIRLINDHADAINGIVRPVAADRSPKWHNSVMEGRVIDQIMLEIPADNERIWLNASGKAIWELCDGSRTVDEIGSELSKRFASNGRDLTADVVSTVSQLRAAGFLNIR